MRDRDKRHWPWIAGFCLAYAALALVVDNSYYQLILTVVLIWAVMGLAWNLLSGYSGLVSFGHAAFFGLGAYFVVIAQLEWALTPWLGIPLAALIGGVAGLVVGVPTFRLRGHYFALAMLAYPLALLYIFEWLGFQEATIPMRREAPWRFMQFSDGRVYVLLALALLLTAMVVTRLVERSRFGLALAAIKQDETAAEAAGIPTLKWKLRAIVLSGAMAAAAGGFYAVVQLVVTPASVFGMLVSAQALTVAMFGGVGTVWGPVIGAVVLVPLGASLDAELAEVLPGIQGVVYGVAIIGVILLAPEGLFWKLRDRVAARHDRSSRRGDRSDFGELAEVRHDDDTEAAARRFAVASNEPAGTPVLAIDGLAKSYGGLKAVDNVSLTVQRGEILGIIGPNGAGKTTLFNLMNGLTRPDGGKVRFEGVELRGAPSAVCRRGIARTFQVVKPFRRMSLAANVIVGAFVRARDDDDARALAAAALAVVGLTYAAERAAGGASNLELRLMELARALASQPKLLLLDEIFAGLASTEVEQVMGVIRRLAKLGITVVIIEHTMQAMVQLVDRFVVLDHGAVLATGTPDAITRDRRVIEAYLGKKWADGTAGIEHVAGA